MKLEHCRHCGVILRRASATDDTWVHNGGRRECLDPALDTVAEPRLDEQAR